MRQTICSSKLITLSGFYYNMVIVVVDLFIECHDHNKIEMNMLNFFMNTNITRLPWRRNTMGQFKDEKKSCHFISTLYSAGFKLKSQFNCKRVSIGTCTTGQLVQNTTQGVSGCIFWPSKWLCVFLTTGPSKNAKFKYLFSFPIP